MSLRLKVASLIGKYAVLIGATAITINTGVEYRSTIDVGANIPLNMKIDDFLKKLIKDAEAEGLKVEIDPDEIERLRSGLVGKIRVSGVPVDLKIKPVCRYVTRNLFGRKVKVLPISELLKDRLDLLERFIDVRQLLDIVILLSKGGDEAWSLAVKHKNFILFKKRVL